jgi:hypothetical protein
LHAGGALANLVPVPFKQLSSPWPTAHDERRNSPPVGSWGSFAWVAIPVVLPTALLAPD